jgi:hypothetical protein
MYRKKSILGLSHLAFIVCDVDRSDNLCCEGLGEDPDTTATEAQL